MFKVLFSTFNVFLLFQGSISQNTMVGGQLDNHNCLIGAGYTWCESSNRCMRQWIEPCEDNF